MKLIPDPDESRPWVWPLWTVAVLGALVALFFLINPES